jgi:hypothetical protein
MLLLLNSSDDTEGHLAVKATLSVGIIPGVFAACDSKAPSSGASPMLCARLARRKGDDLALDAGQLPAGERPADSSSLIS